MRGFYIKNSYTDFNNSRRNRDEGIGWIVCGIIFLASICASVYFLLIEPALDFNEIPDMDSHLMSMILEQRD